MPSLLDLYKQLSALHDEMADAAFSLDWDRLTLQEQKSAELTQALQNFSIMTLGEDERSHVAALIRQIIEKQALVRNEIKTWQEDVTPLLSTLNRNQQAS